MDEKDLSNAQCLQKDKKSKKSKKTKKRKHSSSDSASDTSPKRLKSKKHKKKCKKKHKHAKDKQRKSSEKTSLPRETGSKVEEDKFVGPEIPKEILDKALSMAPMSKEEWEKKQNTIKRVFDESTGRSRLIRGEGEIIEEIVSRDRHQAINRKATQGDGDFFQSNVRKYI